MWRQTSSMPSSMTFVVVLVPSRERATSARFGESPQSSPQGETLPGYATSRQISGMRRGHGPNIIASFRLIGCWRLPPTTIQMPHNNRKHLIINKQARELGFRGLECAEQVSSLAGVHSRDAHMPQRLRCCR